MKSKSAIELQYPLFLYNSKRFREMLNHVDFIAGDFNTIRITKKMDVKL